MQYKQDMETAVFTLLLFGVCFVLAACYNGLQG